MNEIHYNIKGEGNNALDTLLDHSFGREALRLRAFIYSYTRLEGNYYITCRQSKERVEVAVVVVILWSLFECVPQL
jgi:hypothetical protein